MDAHHLCLLYETPAERLAGLVSFHAAALRDGFRCIHVAPPHQDQGLAGALRGTKEDLEGGEDGDLLFLTPDRVDFASDEFSPEDALTFWRRALEDARRLGYAGLAVSGDLSRAAEDPRSSARLTEYEASFEAAFRNEKIHALCCYDRRSVPADALARAFCMHRTVLMDGETLRTEDLVEANAGGSAAVPWLGPLLGRLRRTEEELRAALTQREQLLAVAPVGIYTCDAEGLITAFNDAAVEIWGRAPSLMDPDERFCGSFRLHLPDGTPLPHDRTPMARALREGVGTKAREVVIERPDGTLRTVLVSIQPTRDSEGRVLGAINCFVDVTERKEIQARLAAIVESAEDSIISKDLDGVITSWNEGAVRLFGYKKEEAVGQPITFLFPEDRLEEEEWILERLRRGGRVETYETVRRRKDGSLLEVSLTVSPLFDGAGRVVGASKISRDITEQKRAERGIREAARRKDEFLAMLAHELRNPLAPIRSAIELLREGSASGRERALGALERQTNTLARLVNDLLDVSRVTTGRVRLEPTDLDLTATVRSAVQLVREEVEARGHALFLSVPDGPLRVEGDATRIDQVMANLLSNAARYTPRGGKVWVTLERDGEEAVLRVRDDGPGIDPDLEPRIFELFAQGNRSLDRTEGGLGVGLALTKQLVELHGGTISVRNVTPDGGCEFTVRLPVLGPDHSEEAELAMTQEDVMPDRKMRVLCVEDLADAREVAELVLESMGHEVATAADGPTALEEATRFRPDVILLDIGLPGMDGYEVARRIRGNPALKDTVLVAVTGYAEERDRARTKEAGFDHHLVKPVEYLTTIRRLLAELPASRIPHA